MTEKHIYINGVYRKVIEEILQSNQPIGYLQAYSPYKIKELVKYPPDEQTKWDVVDQKEKYDLAFENDVQMAKKMK